MGAPMQSMAAYLYVIATGFADPSYRNSGVRVFLTPFLFKNESRYTAQAQQVLDRF